jgi:ketosteroid isomerase-like protein
MRSSFALVVLLLAAALPASGQAGEPQAGRSQAGQDVVAVYRQFNDAMVRKDGAALERILADDFSETDTSIGVIKSRADFVAPYRAGLTPGGGLEAVEANDPKVSLHGGTAVLTVRAVFRGRTRDGEGYSVPALITAVFEKQRGRWRMIAAHGSRIDTPQPQAGSLSAK